MCGIAGIIAKRPTGFCRADLDIFDQLFLCTELRGEDSSGVFSVTDTGDVIIHKEGTKISQFRDTNEYKDLLKTSYRDGRILVGHGRKATVGTISDRNAHPFVINEEIVLVHNGSLYSHKSLCDKSEVDSEAIASHIHKNWDVTKTDKENIEILDKIYGAFALVWYDVRNEHLNIVRNSQRPLAIAELTTSFVIASEIDMLKWILNRNNEKTTKIVEVPTKRLLSLDFSKDKTEKFEETDIPVFVSTYQSNWKNPAANYNYNNIYGMDPDENPFGDATNLSKNRFKSESKALVGREINFFVEDFTEYTTGDGMSFYGRHDGFNFFHEVIGFVDEDLGLKVILNHNYAKGKIKKCDYQKNLRKMIIEVEMLTPDPYETSTTSQQTTIQ